MAEKGGVQSAIARAASSHLPFRVAVPNVRRKGLWVDV